MRHDNLLTPISEAEPCGPDLDEVGDDAYLNYMLKTDNLLPSRYLDFSSSTEGVPFDPSVIDLRGEVKTIAVSSSRRATSGCSPSKRGCRR